MGKVFGIGFHKTGTTSLAKALTMLGYRVTGPNAVHRRDLDDRVALEVARELLPQFDAFQDAPWAYLYRELDRLVPGSRFVLTVRPEEEWLTSVVRHFGRRVSPLREWVYGPGLGSPIGNEHQYLERYRRHDREVRAYFAHRPDDLLIMDVTGDDGWEVLCPFLDRPAPDVPFPHVNDAATREGYGPLRRVKRRINWMTRRLRS